jgi:hypothetical protein
MIARFITDNFNFIKEFNESLKNPKKVQERVLLRIVSRNKNTEYGKAYGFNNIHSVAEFQKKVLLYPMKTYFLT